MKQDHKSVARIDQHTTSDIGAAERHDERKNNDYGNVNVDPDRIPMNVHYKSPGDKSYMDILREKEESGELSRRGLRADGTVFDEMVLDVNTNYFEEHGGYDYAVEFYKTAYEFAKEKYGDENIVSAVMHADEINLAATELYGKPVYHYHMHIIAFPVVEKEILWSKRCKTPELRGTVKEVIRQISHAKKWESRIPMTDEKGKPVFNKKGKPLYRASYSILQDEVFDFMSSHGFKDFTRGTEGSTAEHLSSLQYQIEKDRERLAQIKANIEKAAIEYEPAMELHKTYSEIDASGKKNGLTGKYTVSKEDYDQLTTLAKEGISGRSEISRLREKVSYYQERYYSLQNAYDALVGKYNHLIELCQPFLDALKHFPELVQKFIEKVKERFTATEKAAETKIKTQNKERG